MNTRLIRIGMILTTTGTGALSAAIIDSGTAVTGAAPEHSDPFGVDNLFASDRGSEYATGGGGAGDPFSTANGTWIEFDFGSAVTMDRMVLVSRTNTDDVIGNSRLTFSNDATFDGADTTFSIGAHGNNGSGPVLSFARTTARYVRWEVATSIGSSENLGGIEMRFLNTPAGSQIAATTVIGGSPAFNADFGLANAANGNAGVNLGSTQDIEYASAGAGASMFVDFDFGSTIPVSGFDWFDRMADRTTEFNLLLSDDPTFNTDVTTLNYAPGDQWGLGEEFAPIDARYARFQALDSDVDNTGMQEMIFYTVPETGTTTALLGGLGFLALIRRRPREAAGADIA